MKRVLSLFDYSGNWPAFYANSCDVICLDIKHGFDINSIDSVETALDLFDSVDAVIAAPPCTDFTVSGAQYWGQKDEDGRTAKSLEHVYQAMRLADLFEPTDPDYDEPFFWVAENPVGRLQKLVPEMGKPYYFQPNDFAGHLGLTNSDHNELDRIRCKDGVGLTPEEVEFAIDKNAYTKKTGLWGSFNRDLPKDPIEPVRFCKQGSFTQLLGGKSSATKEKRSHTPMGFAKAFYLANPL